MIASRSVDADGHVDEPAQHLRRPEQGAGDGGGRAEAKAGEHRHHVDKDGCTHEILQ